MYIKQVVTARVLMVFTILNSLSQETGQNENPMNPFRLPNIKL